MTMSGSPNRVAPLPNIVISHEDYTPVERLIAARVTPRLEGASREQARRSRRCSSGTRLARSGGASCPGQVVILGAHLDSWDLGTGRHRQRHGIDGGARGRAGARAIGLKPKRTIRFILFSGEEEGLLGSRAVRRGARGGGGQHAGGPGARQRDGTDRGTGAAGTDELADLWQALLAPVAALGADSVRDDVKTGTDHLSLHSVRGSRVQLRPGPAGVQPHPPLAERHLRQGGGGGPAAGSAVMAVTACGAGEPGRAAAARAEAGAGDGTHHALGDERQITVMRARRCTVTLYAPGSSTVQVVSNPPRGVVDRRHR